MTDEVHFGLVNKSTTSVCPDDNAGKEWKKLLKLFESQTVASKVKIMGLLNSSKLAKSSKDPDEWISELEMLRERLRNIGTEIDKQ